MARPRNLSPGTWNTNSPGGGRAVCYGAAGLYHDERLPCPFNSKESLAAFGRLLLEQEAAPRGATNRPEDREGLTLVQVLDQFHGHAQRHDRFPDGRPTITIHEVRSGSCSATSGPTWRRSTPR